MTPAHRNHRKPGINLRMLALAITLGTALCLVILGGVWIGTSHARTAQVQPIATPAALVKARQACPADSTVTECRGRLREAYAGLAWAKKERTHAWAPTVAYAIRLACTSQPSVDCGWLTRMIHCESHGDPRSQNRRSSAAGLAQFLDGTWSGNRYGEFSVYDPIANALGAAWLAARSGHGPWYASRGCWS